MRLRRFFAAGLRSGKGRKSHLGLGRDPADTFATMPR
jgi:hypothetical protein